MNIISIAAGGVILKESMVLLVQITYGPNKGMWMLPGGYLEPGEALAEAAVREVKEETGLDAVAHQIIAVRDGVRQREGGLESNVYVIFAMEQVGGDLMANESEIAQVAYREIDEVLQADDVVGLSKEMVRAACKGGGLGQQSADMQIKSSYKSYALYRAFEF